MLIYYSCIERLHLLKSIWLFKTSLDYVISKMSHRRTVNYERKQKLFLKPHNETTNETLTICFTLKWKNIWKEQLQLQWGESALWRLFTFAAFGIIWLLVTLFKNYWILMKSWIRIYFILCEKNKTTYY